MTDATTGADATAPSPVREVLAEPNFRAFFIAQVLLFGVGGTLRFTFIWLVVTLTDWPSAEGLVAFCLGVPAMVLSVPAGAWSDRFDRRLLFVGGMASTAVMLVVFTVAIAAGWVTTFWAAVAALVIGTPSAITLPTIQAMVPSLVPQERLMTAVALQNGAGQAANFTGLAVAGVAIRLLGDSGGFALLAVVAVLALVFALRVHIPPRAEATGDAPDRSVRAGASFVFSTEPIRTLILLSLVLGSSFSAMQVSMPRVVDEVYDAGSITAGIVLGAFGVGMMTSSALVAGRRSMAHGRNVALFIGIGLGMGQFLLSLAPDQWVAIAVMLAWGLNAGIAMTSHRTLLQMQTPPELMGRVMGLMMFGFAGGLPFGAMTSSILAGQVGPQRTMTIVGLAAMAICIPLTWRRIIVRQR
ncbi:MAG: MFS transporter [Actinomycetota bacterium]